MRNQQTVLTALGCAGSLAAVLAISSPAIASTVTVNSDDAMPTLVQDDSNPIEDALACTCATCTGGIQRTVF